MKNVLYIHGFNGNPKGGTYDGLVEFFKTRSEYQVLSFPFLKLHTDVEETQAEIEKIIDENNIEIVIGASLGGFYTLCCKRPVKKIVINPCMMPSVEIQLLKDRKTGESIVISDTVLARWKELEKYDLDESFKNAAGIFGKQDKTFHYDENHNFSPLFKKCITEKIVFVDGEHSLEIDQLQQAMKKIAILHEV